MDGTNPHQSKLLEGFSVVEFPTTPENILALPKGPAGFVYVISWALNDHAAVPLYVGQTRQLSGRMSDYCAASFYACTDFRVGEAIRYLREAKACRVTLGYKATENRREEEHTLVRELVIDGSPLLNCLPAYDYGNPNTSKAGERSFVQKFCDLVIRAQGNR